MTKTLDLDLDKIKARASDRADWEEGVLLFVIDLRSVHKVNSEYLSKYALRNDPNKRTFENCDSQFCVTQAQGISDYRNGTQAHGSARNDGTE